MVGEKGEGTLVRPGDFKELVEEPNEASESRIEGLELLRPPPFFENKPILSRLLFTNR